MKQTILILACLMLSYVGSAQQKIQQYAVKSGHVEYQLSGNTTGTKSIWWDNYGSLSRMETKSLSVTKMFGMKTETKTHDVTIFNGANFWSVNLIENTGQKGKVPFSDAISNMTEEEKNEMGKNLLEAFGGQIIGTENILGNKCEVVKMMGAKCWIYKGVCLKSEAKMLGIKSNELATLFDKNISVSKSKFTPPSNVEYEDISQYQQGMFGGMEEASFGKDSYDGDNDGDFEMIPVKYPYEKFQSKVNSFNHNGYRKLMAQKIDGNYSAMFMKGFSDNLAVAATSRKNGNPEQGGDFESFTYKGRKCMFGKMDEDDGVSLIVEVSNYDTYIILVSSSVRSKSEMLEIADKFNF